MAYVPKYLKLQRESAFMGSLVSGSNLVYLDIIDESLNPDQGYIDVETAGYLEPRLRLPGGYIVTGDVRIVPDANAVLAPLHAFCGSYARSANSLSASGAKKVWSYVLKPHLVPITMRAAVNPNVPDGGTYKHRELRGFAIKSIEIAAAAREACTMTLTCQAAKDLLGTRDSTVTFSVVRPFSFTDGTLTTLGGDTLAIEALTLRAERIVADDNFALGSRFLPFLHAAGVSLSGSLDIGFKDWNTFKKFWGSATATEPLAAPQSYALHVKFEGDPIHSGGKKYTLDILCPKVMLDTTNANIDRRERIIQSVDFTGLYDTASQYAVQFTVIASKNHPWALG